MFRWSWLIVAFGLAGCSSLRVSSDYDSAADFSALQTFDWLPAAPVESGDPRIQYDSLLANRVKTAVNERLAAKGFERSAGHADFLVTYHVAIDNKISVTYLNELYGYGPGWGPMYRRNIMHYGYPGREAMVSEYQVGTLILDVAHAADRQLIWRGTASDEVYPDNSAEAREKRVRHAVQKILEQFPPAK
jgi:hypothetical protein